MANDKTFAFSMYGMCAQAGPALKRRRAYGSQF